MKIATRRKKRSHGQIDEPDRISDLPEFILHHILSFLGTKEACRTRILSKKWASVWDTVPFLDFQPHYFIKENLEFQHISPTEFKLENSVKKSVDRYMNFIDRTMQRYSQQNIRVSKLELKLPMFDPRIAYLVDTWLRIAVLNHLEELNLSPLLKSYYYRLPEILFSAKSLKILRCCNVILPYYEVMKLTSLETLKLDSFRADQSMLQRIISSSPLIDLELNTCYTLADISIPPLSKLERLKVEIGRANLIINQETGSLRTFDFHGLAGIWAWPCVINVSALRNLKKLKIYSAGIADEVFLNLLSELTLMDTLELYDCCEFQNLIITSNRLKELQVEDCDLKNAVVDAPNLALFSYRGDEKISLSFANVGHQCEACFHINMEPINTSWFIKLKKFLIKSNIFTVLYIQLPYKGPMRKFNVDTLRKTLVGPAYELREVKLSMSEYWFRAEFSISAFLEGLFLICHPATLSISTILDYDNKFVKSIVETLHNNVQCWQHPLKGVHVESIDCPGLNKYGSRDAKLNFHVKLCW